MTDSTGMVRSEAEFLLYQAEDGQTRVEVRFDGETAWLSLGQMAELFQRDKSVISRHVKNVFEEGELGLQATVAKSATVQREGDREVTREVEVAIAKNYLAADEIEALNRIVTAYLEFAELQALNRKPMYMADWIAKLDDFLRLSERKILQHAGKISHDDAVTKAEREYDRFVAQRAALPSSAEKHFEDAIREVKQLEKKRPPSRKGRKPP